MEFGWTIVTACLSSFCPEEYGTSCKVVSAVMSYKGVKNAIKKLVQFYNENRCVRIIKLEDNFSSWCKQGIPFLDAWNMEYEGLPIGMLACIKALNCVSLDWAFEHISLKPVDLSQAAAKVGELAGRPLDALLRAVGNEKMVEDAKFKVERSEIRNMRNNKDLLLRLRHKGFNVKTDDLLSAAGEDKVLNRAELVDLLTKADSQKVNKLMPKLTESSNNVLDEMLYENPGLKNADTDGGGARVWDSKDRDQDAKMNNFVKKVSNGAESVSKHELKDAWMKAGGEKQAFEDYLEMHSPMDDTINTRDYNKLGSKAAALRQTAKGAYDTVGAWVERNSGVSGVSAMSMAVANAAETARDASPVLAPMDANEITDRALYVRDPIINKNVPLHDFIGRPVTKGDEWAISKVAPKDARTGYLMPLKALHVGHALAISDPEHGLAQQYMADRVEPEKNVDINADTFSDGRWRTGLQQVIKIAKDLK